MCRDAWADSANRSKRPGRTGSSTHLRTLSIVLHMGGMAMKGLCLSALLIVSLLGSSSEIRAEPRCKDECPRSQYSRLHYWTPTLYQVRAYICPSRLYQYPPGPAECIQ